MTPVDESFPASGGQALRDRLSADVKVAMKARDVSTVSALRIFMATLDNASAIPTSAAHVPMIGRLGDVPRRELSSEQVLDLLHAEMASRETAIASYDRLGEVAQAARLRGEVAMLSRYLQAAAHE